MFLECNRKLFVLLEWKIKKLNNVGNSLIFRIFYMICLLLWFMSCKVLNRGIIGIVLLWNINDYLFNIYEK